MKRPKINVPTRGKERKKGLFVPLHWVIHPQAASPMFSSPPVAIKTIYNHLIILLRRSVKALSKRRRELALKNPTVIDFSHSSLRSNSSKVVDVFFSEFFRPIERVPNN